MGKGGLLETTATNISKPPSGVCLLVARWWKMEQNCIPVYREAEFGSASRNF